MKNKKVSLISIFLKSGFISGLAVLFLAVFLVPKTNASITFSVEEREIIKEINDYREKNDLKPLEISEKLMEASKSMAEDMAKNPASINHEHKDSLGRLPAERANLFGYSDGVGENLAAGYSTSAKVFKAWKGSLEHKENILDKDFKVMGIAFYKTDNEYKWYWVNMFGTKARSSDLMSENDYGMLKKVKVTVTDSAGKALQKAKVTVWTIKRKKIASSKTNKSGRVNFDVAPQDEIYVRAIFPGQKHYTKKVNLADENTVEVKIWLEKA